MFGEFRGGSASGQDTISEDEGWTKVTVLEGQLLQEKAAASSGKASLGMSRRLTVIHGILPTHIWAVTLYCAMLTPPLQVERPCVQSS